MNLYIKQLVELYYDNIEVPEEILEYNPYHSMHIDLLYMDHLLTESRHISELLWPVAKEISDLVCPYTLNKDIEKQYIITYYYWDFNKQTFIKTDNSKHVYMLWIRLCNNSNKSYTFRNINNEKLNKTAICINIANIYENIDELRRAIYHELLHCREMYANIEKDVLRLNKTNIYADKTYNSLAHSMFTDMLYLLSEAELHAHLQELYDYVYHHKHITMKDITSKELLSASYIHEFNTAINNVRYYIWKEDLHKNKDFIEIFYDFGLILKKLFNFKCSKLTQAFKESVVKDMSLIDDNIFVLMILFLWKKLQEYQRKVYDVIYKAIQDRKNAE